MIDHGIKALVVCAILAITTSAMAASPAQTEECPVRVESSTGLECVTITPAIMTSPDTCTVELRITNNCLHSIEFSELECEDDCVETTLGRDEEFSEERHYPLDTSVTRSFRVGVGEEEGVIDIRIDFYEVSYMAPDSSSANQDDSSSSCAISAPTSTPSGIPLLLVGILWLGLMVNVRSR